MGLQVRFVHLPRPAKGLRFLRSKFKANYDKTLSDLEYELLKLSATSIVIQAGFADNQIRNDGWPYSKARPEHPGVIVSFRSRGQDLSFPCLTYDDLEDNLRAIALSLEALRQVDRYGVTKTGEQYTGFKQIGAPGESDSLQDAARLLSRYAGGASEGFGVHHIIGDGTVAEKAYRLAAMKTHPDRTGTRDEWEKVTAARDQLQKHFLAGARQC